MQKGKGGNASEGDRIFFLLTSMSNSTSSGCWRGRKYLARALSSKCGQMNACVLA